MMGSFDQRPANKLGVVCRCTGRFIRQKRAMAVMFYLSGPITGFRKGIPCNVHCLTRERVVQGNPA